MDGKSDLLKQFRQQSKQRFSQCRRHRRQAGSHRSSNSLPALHVCKPCL
ncbi:hypothetical protein PSPL106493_08835 [Pseudomonas plecoglossicida]